MTNTSRRRIRRTAVVASVAAPLAALAVVALPAVSRADRLEAHATLTTAAGKNLGTVRFDVADDTTRVTARLRLPSSVGGRNAFHGFHVHANNDPANGNGCVADPAKPASTWFVSADGHLAHAGQRHGEHRGDLPSLFVNADGTSELRFTTHRLRPSDLQGRAVIVHVGADNFGNVPVGPAADQYRPNSRAATAKTASTGNAGDRLACGVIRVTRGG